MKVRPISSKSSVVSFSKNSSDAQIIDDFSEDNSRSLLNSSNNSLNFKKILNREHQVIYDDSSEGSVRVTKLSDDNESIISDTENY